MICWVCNEREAMLFGVTCAFCEAQAVARRYRKGLPNQQRADALALCEVRIWRGVHAEWRAEEGEPPDDTGPIDLNRALSLDTWPDAVAQAKAVQHAQQIAACFGWEIAVGAGWAHVDKEDSGTDEVAAENSALAAWRALGEALAGVAK